MERAVWIIAIAVSNAGIFWLEYVYRSARYDNFIQAVPYIIVPVLVSQAGLFYSFRLAPSIFLCGAVFTLANVGLRVVNAYRLGETPNMYNWCGILCLVVSVILLKVK